MTDNTPGLKKAMKDAKRLLNVATHRIRQNNPATIEAFKKAEADYDAAHKQWVDALVDKFGVKKEWEALSARIALRKQRA